MILCNTENNKQQTFIKGSAGYFKNNYLCEVEAFSCLTTAQMSKKAEKP